MTKKAPKRQITPMKAASDYDSALAGIVEMLEAARRTAARAINSLMTASYWELGRRIVELEQGGRGRAAYGERLLERMAADLTRKFGRGFGVDNLERMRAFYQAWPSVQISATVSRKSATLPAGKHSLSGLAQTFPLPWSHHVTLLSVKSEQARQFYEAEALRGGWSIRQLRRQINTQFYERTLLSHNKAAMLTKGAAPKPEDRVTPEEEIKDPFVLEVRCDSNAVSLIRVRRNSEGGSWVNQLT
jgi:hypothetical protein